MIWALLKGVGLHPKAKHGFGTHCNCLKFTLPNLQLMSPSIVKKKKKTGQQNARAQKAGQGARKGNPYGRKYLTLSEHTYVLRVVLVLYKY